MRGVVAAAVHQSGPSCLAGLALGAYRDEGQLGGGHLCGGAGRVPAIGPHGDGDVIDVRPACSTSASTSSSAVRCGGRRGRRPRGPTSCRPRRRPVDLRISAESRRCPAGMLLSGPSTGFPVYAAQTPTRVPRATVKLPSRPQLGGCGEPSWTLFGGRSLAFSGPLPQAPGGGCTCRRCCPCARATASC